MATGEQKWSSRGESIKRFTNKPIKKGTYGFELLGNDMAVKLSQEDPDNSIPRIGVRFLALKTAEQEGQKDRLYFHDFYLSLKPGKDAVVMPRRGGQIIEFARANGDELDDITLLEKTIIDPDGDGEQTITVKYLDPQQVMEYLESKVGSVTEGKLTIEAEQVSRGSKEKYPLSEEHPGKNKMEQWTLDESKLAGDQGEEEEAPARPAKTAAKPAAAPAGRKPLPAKKK